MANSVGVFFFVKVTQSAEKKSSLASSKDGSALFGLLEAFTREFAARHGALIQGQWVAREAVKSQEAKLKFRGRIPKLASGLF